MGIENKYDAVEQLSDMLGLSEDEAVADNSNEEILDEQESTDKESSTKNTTLVNDEQLALQKEITKIDVRIEQLETSEVDVDVFYENIEEHLSEDEQALEFSDKSAYMKLISKKAKEYEKENSHADEIAKLQEQKKEQESVYERQSAILSVIEKYPSYVHEDVLEYFTNELSKAEQKKIYDSSSSYEDVYEKTFLKLTGVKPSNISTKKTPNLPNLNNSRKQQLKTNDVESSLKSDDEKLSEALGF